MMKIRRIVLLAGLLACAYSADAQLNPEIASVINAVNLDSLSQTVRELTGEVFVTLNGEQRKITSRDHSTPVNYAAEYIALRLRTYGYTVVNQHYGAHGRNVYAFVTQASAPSHYFILSSHYDAFPYMANAPGADDNISNVAVCLEAARLLKDHRSQYGLLIAFWDEEEVTPGMFGSRHFADSAATAHADIAGVLNGELLGYDGNGDNLMTLHTGPVANSAALAQTMIDVNATYATGLTISLFNPGSGASDHSSFWEKGYGAVMQAQDGFGDMNPGYHTMEDVFSHFSLPYYHRMARLAIGTISTLIELGEALPVELSAFSVQAQGAQIYVQWNTACETNNAGFEVEKKVVSESAHGPVTLWERIGFVNGHGTCSTPQQYFFVDANTSRSTGMHTYRLKQLDRDGAYVYSAERSITLTGASAWKLMQNFPNPFNPSTSISFDLPVSGHVRLTVFDMLGRRVAVLADEERSSGRHTVAWDASGVAAGVYCYRIETRTWTETKSMLLLE
ncbi:MAG TPA: M20/M25/M40 family metallo-hydrolase [Bacteroidota bacterium]|nr:M20/M25/M40 family metallo-hydrolase [Bacteroidota bacterium]